MVRADAELFANGGLQTVAIQNFPFDFGGLESFLSNQLDPEQILVFFGDVLERAKALSRIPQESGLQPSKALLS